MQKAKLWSAVDALDWFGVQAMPFHGQPDVVPAPPVHEQPDVDRHVPEEIQIEVTSGGIGYSNKDSKPIPELTFGKQFNLTVTWDEPAVESLTLSEFRLVAFDPTAYANGTVIWPPDPDYRLELQDEHGNPIRSVSFSYSDGSTTTRTLILKRVRTVREVRTSFRASMETPQLILFTVSARAGKTEFVLDPPWVGKPPVG